MNRSVTLFGLFLTVLLLSGCSGLSNPAQPQITFDAFSQSVSNPGGNNHILWGIWHITINPDNMVAEATPLRGVEFTCNVTQFLQPPFSSEHMLLMEVLPDSTPETGFFAVEVTIQHPFPDLPFYCGFDVRGILMSDGTHSTEKESLIFASDGDTLLQNPDGWSRWWNSTEFTTYETIFGYTRGKLGPPLFPSATLNGFKYFADDLDSEENLADLDPTTRGSFSNEGTNSRRFNIKFKMDSGTPVFDFNYAVSTGWEEPDGAFAPDYPIEAFSLLANSQEAYWIDADFTDSTVWFVSSEQKGGDLHIALEIGDWGALEDEVTVPDEIAEIWVESSNLGFSPVNVLPSATASDGNGVTTSVFTFDITSVEPSGLSSQTILISVIAGSPENYQPQIPGGNTFEYPDNSLAAYMFFDVPVLENPPNVAPTVLSIVPDSGYLDTGNLPVQITGTDFASDAYAELVHNTSATVIEAADEIIAPDGTTIDCTFDMDSVDGAELGTYHVKVTNPGPPAMSGQLDDGFTINEITSTCDESFETVLYAGELQDYLKNPYMIDITFNRDGLLLSNVSSSGYHLYGFDVTQNGMVAGTQIINNMIGGGNRIVRLDVDDYTGNIMYITGNSGNTIVVYSETGTHIESISNQNTSCLQCMDTDEDGSIWTVGFSGSTTYINHYTWTGSGYSYDAASSIISTELSGAVCNRTFDCAVSYHDRKLLIVNNGDSPYKGKLVCYDISTGIPVWEYTLDQFLPYDICTFASGNFRSCCDIEIDHTVPLLEHCRVLVMCSNPFASGTAFLKMDVDGTILDTRYHGHYQHALTINPNTEDPDGSFVTCNKTQFISSQPWQFNTYEVPTGW